MFDLLSEALRNSTASADIKSLAIAMEAQGIAEVPVGTKMQWGDKACVIALASGKRVMKVMAHLPNGLTVGKAGLRVLYNTWSKGMGAAIPAERAQAVLLAAVLEGDDGEFHSAVDEQSMLP